MTDQLIGTSDKSLSEWGSSSPQHVTINSSNMGVTGVEVFATDNYVFRISPAALSEDEAWYALAVQRRQGKKGATLEEVRARYGL